MEIVFTKISDQEHSVRIRRSDGSEDTAVLNSRSFLRHDLAHLAVESEVPLALGFWGSVAQGASLKEPEIDSPEIMIAESLAGPVQTLMRIEADKERYYSLLLQIRPELASEDLASRIQQRCRKLLGHWKATPYRGEMVLKWDENLPSPKK